MQNAINPEKLHEKIILFTVQVYLENAISDKLTEEPVHHKIVSGIKSYKMMRGFTKEEHTIVLDLGKHEYITKLKKTEVSFIVYALELLRLLVDNGNTFEIGVSKKKLMKGKTFFSEAMIALRQTNTKEYTRMKEIINDSVINAKLFFHYMDEEVKKSVKKLQEEK